MYIYVVIYIHIYIRYMLLLTDSFPVVRTERLRHWK